MRKLPKKEKFQDLESLNLIGLKEKKIHVLTDGYQFKKEYDWYKLSLLLIWSNIESKCLWK